MVDDACFSSSPTSSPRRQTEVWDALWLEKDALHMEGAHSNGGCVCASHRPRPTRRGGRVGRGRCRRQRETHRLVPPAAVMQRCRHDGGDTVVVPTAATKRGEPHQLREVLREGLAFFNVAQRHNTAEVVAAGAVGRASMGDVAGVVPQEVATAVDVDVAGAPSLVFKDAEAAAARCTSMLGVACPDDSPSWNVARRVRAAGDASRRAANGGVWVHHGGLLLTHPFHTSCQLGVPVRQTQRRPSRGGRLSVGRGSDPTLRLRLRLPERARQLSAPAASRLRQRVSRWPLWHHPL